ncbi:UbiA prenyltransferase family-domain-containing protein [Aspergillus ambiguus]|uniref:putative para-hydroxybenzoate-polyprenyltransferase Coq2 n=1 Tax=Aspergillus ambiguus TaxID=176160 RepID=UPI003CCE3FA7
MRPTTYFALVRRAQSRGCLGTKPLPTINGSMRIRPRCGHWPRLSNNYSMRRPTNISSLSITPRKPVAIAKYTSAGPSSSSSIHQSPATVVSNPVTHYRPPQTGLIASLPQSWIPYAELLRLDKPAGTYYLFFPCAFSTLLAAPMASASPLEVAWTTGLFLTGAFIMRGAGCAINDLWDRNLDPHVERTKFRPIARGALSPLNALVFTGVNLLAGLGVLLQFPYQCLWYGIPSLLLVTTYPLAKRVTYYPQAVLGLTFSWGAIMGFPALGVDLLSNNDALGAATALYSSCVAWTVLYDMIYAHMDIKDDVAAGIKSIALRHEHNTKTVLSGLAAVQVGLLAAAGVAAGAGPIFFVGSCGSAALTLGAMIWKVQLKNVQNCWWWFKNGLYAFRPLSRPSYILPSRPTGFQLPSILHARLLSSETRTAIDKAVASAPVVLFMKGTPETPQCGFSRASIQILGLQGVDPKKFVAFNVLEDPELREGIKEYSDWPTIPQLYLDKEFVGGCDILMSMHQNGDLAKMLEEKGVLVAAD